MGIFERIEYGENAGAIIDFHKLRELLSNYLDALLSRPGATLLHAHNGQSWRHCVSPGGLRSGFKWLVIGTMDQAWTNSHSWFERRLQEAA